MADMAAIIWLAWWIRRPRLSPGAGITQFWMVFTGIIITITNTTIIVIVIVKGEHVSGWLLV